MNVEHLWWAALIAVVSTSSAQTRPEWVQPQEPFKVFGDTYYVGTHGLGSILITSPDGHVLIDGALPESALPIAASIRKLGFRIEDVKWILNSHVHFDHAGGMAELQRLSGAKVAASAPAAKVLTSGVAGSDDPQFGRLPNIDVLKDIQVIKDGARLTVGTLVVTMHFTPGHTPGGTSWSWKSCEGFKCVTIVYADSLNPVAAPGYRYGDTSRKANAAQWLEGSFAKVSALPCDIVLAPHPEFVNLFERLARREQGDASAMIDADGCRRYVDGFRQRLKTRLAEENSRQN